MKRFLVLLGSFAVFPALIHAQGRGMAGGARSSVAAAPVAMRSGAVSSGHVVVARSGVSSGAGVHVGARTGTLVRVHSANGTVHLVRRVSRTTGRPVRRSLTTDNLGTDFGDAVPGLGFDYAHLAAVHPNGFRHRRVSSVGGFFPFFSGGFVMPSIPTMDEEVVGDEEEVAEQAPRRVVHVIAPEPAPSSGPSYQGQGPIQPSEEYVFVRRDGTVFFAVAYSWENGALRYITNQGLRGTLTRDSLDLSATQQFNEQRGLSFRSPA
jgi:hypothetical protein